MNFPPHISHSCAVSVDAVRLSIDVCVEGAGSGGKVGQCDLIGKLVCVAGTADMAGAGGKVGQRDLIGEPVAGRMAASWDTWDRVALGLLTGMG